MAGAHPGSGPGSGPVSGPGWPGSTRESTRGPSGGGEASPRNSPRWIVACGLVVLAVGAAVRIETYLDNPSMWLDEAGLALSFLQIDYGDLLSPLPIRAQQAPPLFNLLALALVDGLGHSERVFRLLPLALGLASLPLFHHVARRVLSARGALFALCLLAGTPLAIRYSAEFKHYGMDLFATIALVATALAVRRSQFRPGACAGAAVAGAACVWASYTAIFVLAGIGIALLLEAARGAAPLAIAERRARIRNVCGMGAVWLLAFAGFWWIVGRESAAETFYRYWAPHFAPFPPTSLAELAWYPTALLDLARKPLGLRYAPFVSLLLLGGAAWIHRRDRILGLLLTAPLAVVGVASAAGQYPVHGRLVFFAVPLFLLFIAESADRLARRLGTLNAALGAAFALLVLAPPIEESVLRLATREGREETRALIGYYLEQKRPGDGAYCYYKAYKAFAFYTHERDDAECQIGVTSREEPERYLEELAALRGRGRVWFLFSHVAMNEEREIFLPFLERHGQLLDARFSRGASLYLYRL